ncbi:MAG: YihY family inner membrane protein [Desulfobacterales bacterium]|jgi:membrane protein|nr:YihY family inner membrane protein [Desulfobacterales bacterium]
MKTIRKYYVSLSRFFSNDIWQDPNDAGGFRIHAYQFMRIILLTINGLRDHFILLRASALAYSTILAIVPILAIAFSVMKGLGVQTRIERVMISYLTADQEELTSRIFDYITKTDFKVLGAMGTVMLIYAVLVMLGNVEKTFNHFWGVTRSRRFVRRLSNYFSILILGPLVMVLSTAMIASFPSSIAAQILSRYEFFQWALRLFDSMLPNVLLWTAFSAMYILIPNTRVKLVPAMVAGVVCGTLWEIAFNVFTGFNVGVTNYNKIYGTFAVLPVFIIWLYISWIIVLIGAQLSHAIQNIASLQQEFDGGGFSYHQREKMAFMIMLKISEHFHNGAPQMNMESLAQALSIPLRLMAQTIQALCDQGLLQSIHGDEPIFQPARNPALITLYDISRAMRHDGAKEWRMPDTHQNKQLSRIESEKAKNDEVFLGKTTLLDLMGRSETLVAR